MPDKRRSEEPGSGEDVNDPPVDGPGGGESSQTGDTSQDEPGGRTPEDDKQSPD